MKMEYGIKNLPDIILLSRPPFWQTWWFYLLCAIGAVVCIIGFVKVRERNLLQEKAVLEQKVKERTSELARKKQGDYG